MDSANRVGGTSEGLQRTQDTPKMSMKYKQYETLASGYEKHPDQGLKTCRKKLQKDPNNVVYLLAQAHFLQRLAREQEALASCNAIKGSPMEPLSPELVVVIQEIIATCQHALSTFTYVGGINLSTLWKEILDIGPGTGSWAKETYSDMLRAALSDEYWDLALQLFARLQKENPKTTQYHFAWVALAEMQADKMLDDDKTSQNLRMLAYRSLQAAVKNTLDKKDAPRKILSAKELRLVTQIYHQQNYDNELLTILDSSEIGIDSEVGKNDIEFIRAKIEALLKLEKWEDLTTMCFSNLEKLCSHREEHPSTIEATPGNIAWADDWFVWRTLVNASTHTSKSDQINDLIKRFLAITPKSRNAGRASLLYKAYHDRAELLNGCITFYNVHRISRSCFEDIREFLVDNEEEQQKSFCQWLAEKNDPSALRDADKSVSDRVTSVVVSAVNTLKMNYFVNVAKIDAPSKDRLDKFISVCLSLYNTASNEGDDSGDDACILAIMALVKLDRSTQDTDPSRPYLIQAACLLENLRDDSPNNYKATLFLLLISQLLGLVSISLSAFQDLSLREIQYDTLSHLLYTRISTVHPFGSSIRSMKSLDDRHKDPLSGIEFALKWKPKAVGTFMNFMSKDVEKIQFDKILEFSQFKERLEKSFTRVLLKIEKRRIARLTNQTSLLEESLEHFRNATSDNRDFDVIPDFEYYESVGMTKFGNQVLTGSKPGMYWLARYTLNDALQTMLTWKSPAPTTQVGILTDAITYLKSHAGDLTAQLTPSEQLFSHGWDKLQPITIYLILGPSAANASKDLKTDTAAFYTWLSKDLPTALSGTDAQDGETSLLPHYTILQPLFLHLEFLKGTLKFIDVALLLSKQKGHHANGKISAGVLQDIKKVIKEQSDFIHQRAKDMKERLGRSGMEDVIKAFKSGGEIGEAVGGVVGEQRMRKYAREFIESAVDGLEGLLKVKI